MSKFALDKAMINLTTFNRYVLISLKPAPWWIVFNTRYGLPTLVSSDVLKQYVVSCDLTSEFLIVTCNKLGELFHLVYPDINNLYASHFNDTQSINLKQIGLGVSTKCNLSCRNCFFANTEFLSATKNRQSLMSIHLVRKILSWYLSSAVRSKENKPNIRFGVVEAMINWKAIKYAIDFAEQIEGKDGVEFSIDTNLTLLNSDRAEGLIKHNVEVFTSLDGIKEFHNQRRIPTSNIDCFDLTLSNIKYLIEKGLPDENLHITATLTNQTYSGVCKEFIEQIIGLGVKSIFIELDSMFDLEIPIVDITQRIIDFKKLSQKHGVKLSGLWETPLLKLRRSRKNLISGVFCGAMQGTCIDILPDGSVRHCGYAKTSPGNFEDFLTGSQLNFKSNLDLIHRQRWNECLNCPLEFSCGAQCLVTRESFTEGNISKRGLKTLCSVMINLTLASLKEDAFQTLNNKLINQVIPLYS
jgi:uncharacterized protein